jgi:hypothetical protein
VVVVVVPSGSFLLPRRIGNLFRRPCETIEGGNKK